MVRAIQATESGSASQAAVPEIDEFLENIDVVAVGSGLSSKEDDTKRFVERIVKERKTPVVLDADALTALSPFELEGSDDLPLILTPHDREFARLLGSQNIVPVRRAKDNMAGISTGRDDGTLEIRPLSAGANPFKPGDIIVTTGTGGLYSPNIPVAVVVAEREDIAIAVPLASPARVEMIMVERTYDANIPVPQPPVPVSADAAP